MDSDQFLKIPIECLTAGEICGLIDLLDAQLEARAEEEMMLAASHSAEEDYYDE